MKLRNMIRNFRRFFWKKILRLNNVHSTFLAGGFSSISTDFCAGAFCYVGPGCQIGPGVSINDYTIIGPGVKILGNDHIFNFPGRAVIFSGRPIFKKTKIGKDVWIGAGAIIMAGVTIQDGAIIAAGAVVVHDVEPMTIIGGIPARFIRNRFNSLTDNQLHIDYLSKPASAEEYPKRIAT